VKFKLTLIFTAVEAALFIAAPFGAFAFAEARTAAGFRLVFLPLMLFPLACYALGFITQIKCGFALALALLTGAVFIPAAMLHYGSAAISYAAVYAGVSFAGMLSAYPIRTLIIMRRREKTDDEKGAA